MARIQRNLNAASAAPIATECSARVRAALASAAASASARAAAGAREAAFNVRAGISWAVSASSCSPRFLLAAMPLLILDYWEKLAGASLALCAAIRLCQQASLPLVAPFVHSSIFMPDASGSYPLGTYYDVAKLRNALHPVQLVSLDAWRRSLPDNRTDDSSSSLIIVAYSDFPVGCRTQLAARAAHDFLCPAACLSLSGVRRMIAVSTGRLPEIARLPRRCLLAAELREAVSSPRARAHALFRLAGTHASSVAILNWRRHDGGRPLLAAPVASALRARAIVPARGVVAAAHRLLRRERLQPHSYALVQLRSNHLAQAAHAASVGKNVGKSVGSVAAEARSAHSSGAPLPGTAPSAAVALSTAVAPSAAVAAGVAVAPSAAVGVCASRVVVCVQRLTRAARKLAPPEATVVASDLSTLHQPNQDGATHRRKSYVRECLQPALPALRRWYASAGRSFNCTPPPATRGAGASERVEGAGQLRRSKRRRAPSTHLASSEAHRAPAIQSAPAAQRARRLAEAREEPPEAADSEAAERACDAGWLGLVDLVLAAEAASLVAIDAGVWKSAYLEWILQLRAQRARTQRARAEHVAATRRPQPQTHVIRCS